MISNDSSINNVSRPSSSYMNRPSSSMGRPNSSISRPNTAMGIQRQPGTPINSNERPPNSDNSALANRIAYTINTLEMARPRLPAISLPSLPNLPLLNTTGLNTFFSSCASGISQVISNITNGAGGGIASIFSNSGNLMNFWQELIQRINALYSVRLGLMLINPSYDNNQDDYSMFENFLISSSNPTSVEYYSQDPFENLKFKISMRCVRSFLQTSSTNANTDTTSNNSDKKEVEYTLIFGWQQKVFSPRELVRYYIMEDPQTVMEQQCKREINDLLRDVEEYNMTSKRLRPYAQEVGLLQSFLLDKQKQEAVETNRKKKKRKKGKEKASESEAFNSSNSDSDIKDEEQPENIEEDDSVQNTKQTWGTNGFLDVLCHRLSTIIDADGIETDCIQKPISCSARAPFDINQVKEKQIPIKKDSLKTKKRSKRPKTMYIVANFGHVVKSENKIEDWNGEEYVLCIIKVMPDGSFILKPGLSTVPDEDDDQLDSEVLNKVKQQEELLKKRWEKKYIFRSSSGEVHEYTINLFNEFRKDPEIDIQRKDIIHKMNERALLMRRNLVGQEFESPPSSAGETRIHIFGEIVSATDFDSKIYVRYTTDIPDMYHIEENTLFLASSSTQVAIPVTRSAIHGSYTFCNFSFPFEFHCTTSSSQSLPKLYFEVISIDFWNRRRVEGYGYLSIPTTAGEYTFNVPTWKPVGSVRDSMKNYFLGGSLELEDITYTAIPKRCQEAFLNKFGFITEASGDIQVRLQVISQSSNPHYLWRFHDNEPSPLITSIATQRAELILSEETEDVGGKDEHNSQRINLHELKTATRERTEDLIDNEDIQEQPQNSTLPRTQSADGGSSIRMRNFNRPKTAF